MPTETLIEHTSFLGKCYIHWKTRNYGRKIEAISLLLAVAIFMNKKVYEVELRSASNYLLELMEDSEDVDNVMEYVKMKLSNYQENNQAWLEDRQEAFNLIIKNEDLYGCMSDIFNSDDSFDESEELFEEALKRLL
ncbi:hypothetical protein JHD50_05925 [Sulfurimonas sp. MAG313]|nr:hypothetical protein [Sulfurimonas sp. MAG313]MDF1880847.1 hypothetical protein [Sulfurimonas sp. MAG313]